MVAEDILTSVRRYLVSLKDYGIHPSRGVLFGSAARGTDDEFSDIDLVVIAPELDGPLDQATVEKLWSATVIDSRIEPIPCGTREWESQQKRPILDIARQEGITVSY